MLQLRQAGSAGKLCVPPQHGYCDLIGKKDFQIMFREMRRKKQQIPEAGCRRLLHEEKRAALSVIGDNGYPYTVPVNFYYDECDGAVYFHGAKTGHKADSMRACGKVCLTVWNQGFKKEGHWEWTVTSVVVFGRATFVNDAAVIEDRLRRLAQKYYPDENEIEKEMTSPSFDNVQLFSIKIEHMTGKLVNEK